MRKILLLLLILPFLIPAQSIPNMDTSFAGFGRVTLSVWNNNFAYCTAVQPDKKILVGGSIQQNTPTTNQSYVIARYNENGTLDSTFGINGLLYSNTGNYSTIYDIKILSDGKILMAGSWDGNAFIGQLLTDGSFDSGFGNNGIKVFSGGHIRDIEVLPDGSIVGYGQKNTASILVKVSADGQADSSFGNSGMVSTTFGYPSTVNNAMIRQTDGKLVITGAVVPNSSYPQNNQAFIARYTAAGIPDPAFGTNGLILYNTNANVGRDIAQTANGKILVLAEKPNAAVTNIGTTSHFFLLQFNTDGTPDTTFNNLGYVGFGPTYCSSLKVDPQNKIYIGSSSFNSTSYYDFKQIIRLNADGSRDSTFGSNGVYVSNTRVYSSEYAYGTNNMNFTPDGKLVIGSYVNAPGFLITIMRLNVLSNSLSASETFANSQAISVYPNPVKDAIHVQSRDNILSLELTDFSGRIVSKSIHAAKMDLVSISAGTYMLKVKTAKKEETFKIIKK